MRNSPLQFWLLVFLLTLGWGFVRPYPSQAVEDTIIAIVNDDIITLRDLQDFLDSMFMAMRMEGHSSQEIQKVMKEMEINGIRKLIEEKLILDKAKELQLEITNEAIDHRLEEVKKKYPSEEDFLKALVDDGSTISDLRKKITDEYKVKATIEQEVRSKIFVNPQEVTDYYNGHIKDYQKPKRAQLDSIFINKGKDPAAARQKVEEAYAKLKQGTDFQEVAKGYSEASSIGTIEKGQTISKIDEVVFNLSEGAISEPIEVDNGTYIFKIIAHLPEQVSTLDDVKNQIYEKVFQIKLREKLVAWLDELKDKAFIEIKSAPSMATVP